MHQSWPGVRRRRVSQPSIHLPRSVYTPSRKTGAAAWSKLSLGAKNSSLAVTAAPPRRSEARSTSSRKSSTGLSGKQDLTAGAREEFPARVDLLALDVRCLDGAREFRAGPRRQCVPRVELRGIDGPTRLRVPDDEVRVPPLRDRSLPRSEPGELGRRRAHPPGEVRQRVTSLTRGRPRGRQRQAERGDPAPGA